MPPKTTQQLIEEIKHWTEVTLRLEILCLDCDNKVDSRKFSEDIAEKMEQVAQSAREEERRRIEEALPKGVECTNCYNPNKMPDKRCINCSFANGVNVCISQIKQILNNSEKL